MWTARLKKFCARTSDYFAEAKRDEKVLRKRFCENSRVVMSGLRERIFDDGQARAVLFLYLFQEALGVITRNQRDTLIHIKLA